MPGWEAHPGETPFDISQLKVEGIATRGQLNAIEARFARGFAPTFHADLIVWPVWRENQPMRHHIFTDCLNACYCVGLSPFALQEGVKCESLS
jgi:hypothetical protein